MRLKNTWQEIRDPSFIQNLSRLFRLTAPCCASSLQFTSLIFYRVRVRGLGWPAEAWCSVTHFCVFLRFVFGLLYGWKIQTWLIIRFLTESVTCRFFYILVFYRIHDAMCLNKISRTSSRNIGPQHKKYICIFHWTHKCLPNPSWMFAAKKHIFFVSSDRRSQSHFKVQSCLKTECAEVCFWMS